MENKESVHCNPTYKTNTSDIFGNIEVTFRYKTISYDASETCLINDVIFFLIVRASHQHGG